MFAYVGKNLAFWSRGKLNFDGKADESVFRCLRNPFRSYRRTWKFRWKDCSYRLLLELFQLDRPIFILNAVRCPYVRSSVTLGVRGQLSSEWRHNENDVMIIPGLWRYGDWRHVATGCNAVVSLNHGYCIHRVKWRHISVVAVRSPFCGATLSYTVCS